MLRSAHQSLISTLSAVTRASWHPKSQAIWLFVQQHYQADKEKIKAPQLSFLCEGNSLLTDGFSSQRDNNAEIIMMFSVKFPWLSGLSNNLCWSDDVIQNGGWNLAALQMPTFKGGWRTVRQWAGSSLLWVMACCLWGAKPTHQPMMVCYYVNTCRTIGNNFQWNLKKLVCRQAFVLTNDGLS